MANENIGYVTCGICGWEGAYVRASKNGRLYVYCDDCEQQSFARGAKSDAAIRAKMRPIEQPAAPPPSVGAGAAPVAPSQSEDATEAAPAAPGQPEEPKTIFDVAFWRRGAGGEP